MPGPDRIPKGQDLTNYLEGINNFSNQEEARKLHESSLGNEAQAEEIARLIEALSFNFPANGSVVEQDNYLREEINKIKKLSNFNNLLPEAKTYIPNEPDKDLEFSIKLIIKELAKNHELLKTPSIIILNACLVKFQEMERIFNQSTK